MNGIHLNISSLIENEDSNNQNNIFELRRKIYNDLIEQIYTHIDYLYNKLLNEKKSNEVNRRSIKNIIDKESLTILYKGVEIPLLTKTCIILDNIEYIPIFQMVDKPIHLQKDGKYIVIKNNIRNTYIKLDGNICNVLYKSTSVPLMPYLLYIYPSIKDMLKDFNYKIIDDTENIDISVNSNKYYIVPEYYSNTFLIVERNFEPRTWKEYFISPFSFERFEFQQKIFNKIIDTFNSELIPEITENGENIADIYKDIKNESVLDEEIAKNKERKKTINEKNTRDYILLPHRTDQNTLDKIYTIISTYYSNTGKSSKKNITKAYLESSLFKYTCKDITMNNISIFNMIIDNIKNNRNIPECYNIADISQKNLRFLEWYAMKLSSVNSYPEQDLIMEVAKTEPKRIYNNTVNPIAELSMLTRVNLFGKGAIPIEAAGPVLRNLHDSYKGVISSIDTPAGKNVGVSLHLTPEVNSCDIEEEVNRLKYGLFDKIYEMQEERQ